MANPLRVLIFEGRQEDAELSLRELRRAGFRPDARRVDNERDFLAALDPQLDLIIADYSLPQFDGLRALKLVQERNLDIPFILVSGAIGEELAVDAIKQGAFDYVMKDRLARLGQSVKRALEEKRLHMEKKTDRQLSQTTKRLANILDHAAEAVIALNAKQNIIVSNRAAERMFGYPAEELLGRTLDLILPERFVEIHRKHFSDFVASKENTRPLETRHPIALSAKRRDGSEFPVEIGLSKLDEDGEPVYVAMIVDVTERKRAEEALRHSEQRFRSLIENSTDAIALAKADGTILYASPAAGRILGIPSDSLIGKSTFSGIHPDDLKRAKQAFDEVRRHPGMSLVSQFRFRHKDRTWRWIEGTGTNMLEEPSVRAMVANYRDMTERKRAESELQAERDFAQRILSTVGEGLTVTDADGRFEYVNPAYARMVGYTPQDLVGKKPKDVTVPKDHIVLAQQSARRQTGESASYETLLKHLDGHEIPVQITAVPRWHDGTKASIAAIADLTERKRAEQVLRESEQRFRSLIENASDGIVLVAEDGTILYDSPAVTRILGYSAVERVGKSVFDFFHPDERQTVRERFDQFARQLGATMPTQGRFLHKEGSWRWIEGIRTNLLADPKVQAIVVNYRDVTERKRAEEALLASENRYRSLFENLLEGFAYCRIILEDDQPQDFVYLAVNSAFEKLTGLKDVVGKKVTEVIPGIKDSNPELFEIYGRVALGGEPERFETWLEPLAIWFSVYVYSFEKGYFIAVFDNVTERKRAEEEIRRRAGEFEALYDTSRGLATYLDVPALLDAIVDRARKLLGASSGFVYLYDRPKAELELTIAQGFTAPLGTRLKVGEGMAGRVAQTRQPVRLDDYHAWEKRSPKLKGLPFRAIIEVPMLVGGELIGVLGVNEFGESTRQFTEGHERLLSLFAGQAASAVHNARLLEETKRRASEFEALYDTARDLSTQTETARLLQTIVDRARALLNAPAGAVYLYDATNDEVELAISAGAELPLGTRLRMGEGAAGRVAQSREPLIVDDYQNWKHRSPQYKAAPFSAVLDVPMLYGGKLVGVLAVHELGKSKRKFTDADARLLTLLASQAASTVHNAHLLEETRARANEFATLYETTRDLTTEYDLQRLLRTIVERAARLLHASDGEIQLYDERRGDLELIVNLNSPTLIGGRTRLGEGLAGHVAQTRKPLVVDDYQTWKHRLPRYEDLHVRGVVDVPMLYGGKLIGVLSVYERGDSTRRFNEQQTQLLSLFAAQAASAVYDARLLDEARRRADEFAALYDISRDIAMQPDTSALMQTIVDRASVLLGASGGSIGIYDAERSDLLVAVARNVAFPVGMRLKIGEGIAGRVAESRQPIIVADYRHWEHRLPQYEETQPISAVMAVPMLYGGELFGVMTVYQSDPAAKRFTEADARLLSLLASQAASAIHNARLLEETKRRAEQLSTLNEIGKAVSAQLELDRVLEVIYEQVQHILPLDMFYVAFYNDQTKQVSYPILYDVGKRFQEPPGSPKKGTFIHQTIETGQPILINRTPEQIGLPIDPSHLIGDTTRRSASLLFAPLRHGPHVMGVMSAQSYTLNAYTEEHLTLFSGIANQVAIAMENARLFTDTQRHLERVQALHEIDNAISGSLDLRVTFNVFLDQITTHLSVDATDILLLNPHTQTLDFAAGRGFRTPALAHTHLRLGDGLAGRAALDQEIVAVPNLAQDADGLLRSPFILSEGFATYFGVPLIAKGRVNGVLEIFHRTPIEPHQEWIDFLETLAEQAAIAIDNAELYANLQRANIDLALAYDTTLEGWSRALDLRDRETEGHTERVTEITLRLAREMGIGDAELVHIRRGALLHDIGKMGIPDPILFKPGPLTDDEWKIMRQHPVFAYELLSPIEFLRPALDIPYCHHEKWDGTGYPRGLSGEQIPLAARLFAVVDVWDALRSDRPYRRAWSETQVREHIRSQAGSHFDPKITEVFLETIK